ncbi:hypothetical protein DB347_12155 [Opitutaceae bacterium EW11]|nr:hypothetical protein DB347_12155 [Opitutaceae bacterium EW11]
MKSNRTPFRLRKAWGLPLCLASILACAQAQQAPAAAKAAGPNPDNAQGKAQKQEAKDIESPETTRSISGGDEAIVLSPFVVDSSSDKGYYSANTLSGTRLNTKIEDLGSSITVVNKQQMEDFALLDMNDVFLYESNTEGIGNYTSYSIDRNGNVSENVSTDPQNANRVRGIGSPNRARNNFRISGRMPIDPITTDSLEISRGPNSTIYGLGNPAGTVNSIAATGNVSRDFTSVQFRADSVGGTRGSIDVNRALIKDKLAIRASGVYQDDQFTRKPSFSRTKRYSAMIQYRPTKWTSIRAMWEQYNNKARRPNAILPRDGVSYWVESGSPTWDPVTATVHRGGASTVVPYNSNQGRETTALGPGLSSGGSGIYARGNLFVDQDGVGLWMMGRASAGTDPTAQATNNRFVQSSELPRANFGPLAQTDLSVTDSNLYDWRRINIAAPNWSKDKVDMFMVELEQMLVNSQHHMLAAQAGWMREDAQRYTRTNLGQGSSSFLRVDVNERLLDGTPNPYFLRPYIETAEPTAYDQPLLSDSYRGQLAYQLTLSKDKGWWRWFGDHTVGAYMEYRDVVQANYRFRDAIISNHAWLAAGTNRANGQAAARGVYRYYLGDANGYNIDYAPISWSYPNGTYTFSYYDSAAKQLRTEQATLGEAYFDAANPQRSENVLKSRGLVMQNHLLDERIITTFGWRKDASSNRYAHNTEVSADGITMNPASDDTWPNDWFTNRGTTTTQQYVVNPLHGIPVLDRTAKAGGVAGFFADVARKLRLTYTKADTFLPAPIEQSLLAEQLPDPSGKTEEYGIRLSILDNKLVFNYNHYKTLELNSRTGDAGIIATRAGRIDFRYAGSNDSFNLQRVLTENIRHESAWANASDTDIATEIAKRMGIESDTLARMNAFPVKETSSKEGSGNEFELNYNPTNYFTLKIAAAEQEAIERDVSPNIQKYIDARLPVWQSIKITTIDGTVLDWFTNRWGSGGVPRDFLLSAVQAPYKLLRANEGKSQTQVRKWRFNASSSLRLSAFSDRTWMKNTALIAAVRWEDKGSIGYYAYADDPTAYDPNRPIYDKAHTYVDLGASYTMKILKGKVRMRLQANLRNAFESGHLQPIGALPDGTIHTYRLVDPRLLIVTTTFDF